MPQPFVREKSLLEVRGALEGTLNKHEPGVLKHDDFRLTVAEGLLSVLGLSLVRLRGEASPDTIEVQRQLGPTEHTLEDFSFVIAPHGEEYRVVD